ncbi:peptide deformylase [Desulfogranum marinum]|uniref:peptide deformylase n=1 Tax=Desulfogranum marinum TaxID=453220 RepID=UPI001962759E|nr:peptide deformylase [Desulfogranum marinum]MBM9514436.1 peptide deformylase [Desulfogranum marinum]
MALLEIITYPHPVLREEAKEITVFDDELKKLVQDMSETMYDAPGVGLAANQVGVAQQVALVDRSEIPDEKKFLVLVNPVISDGEGTIVDEEGCLSVLECQAKVKRFQKIHVTAKDIDGNPLEFDAEDRFARIIQHEVDHLRGTLFIDRLSSLKRTLYKKKLRKILHQQA